MALTRKKIDAIIELARRGVDGERDNARKLCEDNGINWKTGAVRTPKTAPFSGKTSAGCTWQEVDYLDYLHSLMESMGISLNSNLATWMKCAGRTYVVKGISKVCTPYDQNQPLFETGEAGNDRVIFWGTSSDLQSINTHIAQGLHIFLQMVGVYKQRSF